jgi:hypothetical protein
MGWMGLERADDFKAKGKDGGNETLWQEIQAGSLRASFDLSSPAVCAKIFP